MLGGIRLMNKASVMIFLFFSVLIIININEMRNLIIPVKKRKIEIFSLSVGVLALLIITFWYGKTLIHYIVCFFRDNLYIFVMG